MTSFVLKIIAMITMFIDHFGLAIFKYTTHMNVIGRIAFPIFAFQITQGYEHTKNLKKYFFRLFIFALISQIPFMLFSSIFTKEFGLNIFFTLMVGLFVIFIYDKICNSSHPLVVNRFADSFIKHLLAIMIAILLGILAQVCKFDYGFFGIAIILLFYILKDNKLLMAICFSLACIIKYAINIGLYGYHYLYILLCLFTILPIVFICLYNKKQGKKVKYLLYFFYPVHLLVLYLIFGLHS